MDEEFEWDTAKAAENEAKHGVNFETAKAVFRDPFATERIDNRQSYGEERYLITGMIEGRCLTVVYTLRGQTIRLISARAAEPYEKRRYHEENSR